MLKTFLCYDNRCSRSMMWPLDLQCKDLSLTVCDIRYQDLLNVLRFLYLGQITLNQRRSSVFQKWLRILGIHMTICQTPVAAKNVIDDNVNNLTFVKETYFIQFFLEKMDLLRAEINLKTQVLNSTIWDW